MHDFFDKLGAAAKRAAGTVATEVNVAAEKQRLSEAYQDLGKLCYQAAKQDQVPDTAALVARIDGLLERIAELKDRRNVTNVDPTAGDDDFVDVDD